MPMSKTESEDITKQFGDLRSDFDALKQLVLKSNSSLADIAANLTVLKDTLTKKIDDGYEKFTKEIDRIETSFGAEVMGLKAADERLRESIIDLETTTSAKFENLSATVTNADNDCKENLRNLDIANKTIEMQAAKIVRLEKECHRGLQHGRGWNIEIDGIPRQVGDDPEDLRNAFLAICETFNIDVHDIDIETIHRLPSKQLIKPVIIRFISRESVREIHHKKSRLRHLHERLDDLQIDGLTEESQIFIRASQCSYYRCLAFNCRVLKRKELLSKVHIGDDGRISIKLLDGSHVKVSHESILVKNFPNFKGFNFKYDEKETE